MTETIKKCLFLFLGLFSSLTFRERWNMLLEHFSIHTNNPMRRKKRKKIHFNYVRVERRFDVS